MASHTIPFFHVCVHTHWNNERDKVVKLHFTTYKIQGN